MPKITLRAVEHRGVAVFVNGRRARRICPDESIRWVFRSGEYVVKIEPKGVRKYKQTDHEFARWERIRKYPRYRRYFAETLGMIKIPLRAKKDIYPCLVQRFVSGWKPLSYFRLLPRVPRKLLSEIEKELAAVERRFGLSDMHDNNAGLDKNGQLVIVDYGL